MFNQQFRHRKVRDVRRCKRSTHTQRSRADQAIDLMQRLATRSKLTTPTASDHAFADSQRRNAQSLKKSASGRFLIRAQTTPNFFNRNRACPWLNAQSAQIANSLNRRTPAKRVNQYRRIQQYTCHEWLTRATRIGVSLCLYPLRRVAVPDMTIIGDPAERAFDVVPTLFVFEAAANELRDERAALTRTNSAVELFDQDIVESDVQSHVLTIAHTPFRH